MQIIISHVNTDFDALASMIAAKKLYPDAQVVIPSEQTTPVKQYLSIYRDSMNLILDSHVNWSEVTEIILVDTSSLSRISVHSGELDTKNLKLTIYDHHPGSSQNFKTEYEVIEAVGAAVTLLVEEIIEREIAISAFEATLFGLGLYADTGSFKYPNTTIRDFHVASFLMNEGMNLEIIQRFTDYKLTANQQNLLNDLFHNATVYRFDSLKVVVSTHTMADYQMGLATITNKLLDITGADAALSVVQMAKHVYIVGRVEADRITLLPLLDQFGGGGHEHAGSATVKYSHIDTVLPQVIDTLDMMLKPAVTARDIMSSPVRTLPQETSIEEAGRLMYRYGHSGYPVVEDNELLGIATRRDLDKANHHNLGHAPIKAYMSTDVITIKPTNTIEEMQDLIIKNNVGRLPVIDENHLVGIVTRTNIIEMLHNKNIIENLRKPSIENLKKEMTNQLSPKINSILKHISQTAEALNVPVYLVGGIVRDLFLELPNDDIDIVVEGNGIGFLEQLKADYDGTIIIHENFGTGTWNHPSGQVIDVTTARLEYYSSPASLPDVETSTLEEDLYRRDFTINSMAVSLNPNTFGNLVDPFHGQKDLRKKHISVLHNLSFIEDPTRILRAVRFESRFDFLMDHQTENLVLHSIGRVKDLSKDRMLDQMKRLLDGENIPKIIHRLFELKFWKQFGIDYESSEESNWHAKQLKEIYESHSSFPSRWFSYFLIPFYNGHLLYIARQYAKTKEDAKLLKDISTLNDNKEWLEYTDIGAFHRILKDFSADAILFLLAKSHLDDGSAVISYLEKREHLPDLLTGDDLISIGLKPSPLFREIFLELDVKILNDDISTREEAFSWLVQTYNLYKRN